MVILNIKRQLISLITKHINNDQSSKISTKIRAFFKLVTELFILILTSKSR